MQRAATLLSCLGFAFVSHRPGEIAPMSLISHEDVRPWVKSIRAKMCFDNSPKNRYNPAPKKEVDWSEPSWDEM